MHAAAHTQVANTSVWYYVHIINLCLYLATWAMWIRAYETQPKTLNPQWSEDLQPLQLLLEQRLGDRARAEELLEYVRARVPLDTETGICVVNCSASRTPVEDKLSHSKIV